MRPKEKGLQFLDSLSPRAHRRLPILQSWATSFTPGRSLPGSGEGDAAWDAGDLLLTAGKIPVLPGPGPVPGAADAIHRAGPWRVTIAAGSREAPPVLQGRKKFSQSQRDGAVSSKAGRLYIRPEEGTVAAKLGFDSFLWSILLALRLSFSQPLLIVQSCPTSKLR